MLFQSIVILFGFFAVFRAVQSYRRQQLDRRKLLAWVFFWTMVIVVVLHPEITSVIASQLGVGRGTDVVVYAAVAILFYVLFQLSRKVDHLERQLTDLVRRIALNGMSKDDKE